MGNDTILASLTFRGAMEVGSRESEVNMRADGADPRGPTIPVVTGIGDVLHIERVEETVPCVPVLVAFDDGLTPAVEVAMAENEAEPTESKVVLVIALDRVGHDGQSNFVLGTMPRGVVRRGSLNCRLLRTRRRGAHKKDESDKKAGMNEKKAGHQDPSLTTK